MYRYYALGMLALVYAVSYMDRQIISILLDDLKAEFLLTDTQLGLLSGLAFAIFYATLGLPIARLADRSNRVGIISIAAAIWSAITALTATVSSFTQLLIARIGVGVGEAGARPRHTRSSRITLNPTSGRWRCRSIQRASSSVHSLAS